MKIYLAGPMRGYPNANFPAFDYAAAKLRAEGHEVFSPADNDRQQTGADKDATGDEVLKLMQARNYTVRDALGHDLLWICREAEEVAFIRGWELSTGANAERATAIAIGVPTRILGNQYHIPETL